MSPSRVQIARKIDFEDPQVLLYVRILYVGAQLLSLGIYYFATLKVNPFSCSLSRLREKIANIHFRFSQPQKIKQKNDLKVLKYTEPAKPMVSFPHVSSTKKHEFSLIKNLFPSLAMVPQLLLPLSVITIYLKLRKLSVPFSLVALS